MEVPIDENAVLNAENRVSEMLMILGSVSDLIAAAAAGRESTASLDEVRADNFSMLMTMISHELNVSQAVIEKALEERRIERKNAPSRNRQSASVCDKEPA